MRRIIRSLLYTLACVGAVSLLAGARGNTAVAATTVSGYISTDTTWTAANSPYSVSGNVIVRSGATLTIEPGVTVNFNSDKSLQIDGTLIAKGTSASPITFTTAATGTKWAYILFNDSSIDATYGNSGNYVSGSIMEYCVVEYAGGTSVSDNGAIRLNNAHPFINYCTIRNNSAPGIYAYNISGILRITNSTITDNKGSNGAGVYVSHSSGGATTISGNTIKNNTASSSSPGYGGGIYIAYGTVTLTNNTISSNTGSSPGGGGACGGGIYTSQSTITLTNNTISSNTASSSGGTWAYGGGIYTFYSTITLTNNTISSNTASSSDGTGAYGGGIYTNFSTITLTNNTISSNTASSSGGTGAYGGGIYIDNSSTITLTNNTISGNTASSGGGIYTNYSTVTLTKNTISGNTAKNAAAVYYSGNAGNDGKDFKYNTITGNKATGGSDSCTIWVGLYPLLNYNNIYGNTATYELWFDKSQGSANLNAKDNWWGSSDETAVQDKIYDGIDSSTKALVDYYPYSTAIRTDTGVTVTTTPTPTPTVTTSPSPTPVVSPTPVTQSDVTAPVGSVSINSGASYTNSTTVTLNLSATDSVGVTGYYVATSSSTPLASAAGWTSVSSTTSYSGSVSYTLSSGDGSKTVYVWFKDVAGNVSSAASDSITLDTTAPTVTITSPTSSATYTSPNSTMSLGGSASDSTSGVSSVTWSNSGGGSGTASGTTSWSISSITLTSGDNVITVTATDNAGNTNTDTITVTYNTGPTALGTLSLSKDTAYLSGDTIVATVVDADRNTSSVADTLTTALKVTGTNYSVGTDLNLSLVETGVTSGTFVATFKTGATTNTGVTPQIVKAIQGGILNVIYTDTAPAASSVTKTISLSSFDATMAFDADSYSLDTYALVTLADAERNTNYTTAESLLSDVFIQTSSVNSTKVRMVETGADTGTFKGSIQIASSGGTLEFSRIQAAEGETVKISYIDEVNTTGSSRTVTDTAVVRSATIQTPTPEASPKPAPTLPPLPTPAPTLPPLPTPQVSPNPIQEGIVFGIVNDQDEQPLKGVTVTIVGANGRSPLQNSTETDEDGYYEFGGLSQGTYTLTYAKEGYQTQTQDISLNEGEVKDLGTVTMEQVVKGKISGYVANIKGDPIESVRLKLKGIKTKVIKTASSDADGFFEFTDLGADTYVIFAKKKGYKKTQQKVVLEEGETTEIEIEMRKTTKRIKGLLLEEDVQ